MAATGKTINIGNKIPLVPQQYTTSSTTLRYPHSIPVQSTTDYVAFKFYDYKPPFQAVNKASGAGSLTVGQSYQSYNASIQQQNLTEAEGYSPVFLYMPQDIQGQYGANWGGASFGAVFQQLARTIGRSGMPNMSSLNNTIDAITGSLKTAGYKAAVDAMNKGLGTSVSLSQLMSGVSGTIVNPNVEMMYEAPELRGFQLRFKMQARDLGESQAIRGICTQFKRALHASYGGNTLGTMAETGQQITVPKIVQVSFMTGSKLNEYVPQYKPCALTQVDVNYTPDGAWATLPDGSPVATELALTFKETKLIYSQEITANGASY